GVIDEAVIIDDCSFDDTAEICENMLPGIKKHIIRNEAPMFGNEIDLRKKQWEETIKLNPDWILSIDADEIFEDAFYKNVKNMINQKEHDVILFRLYDMWDEKHFREDKYWAAHRSFRPFLLRFQPDFPYEWRETPLHCGRFPANILMLPSCASKFRVKHYGWAKEEDRRRKYENYKKLDPDAIYGDRNQYESILDEKPKLLEWTE
ncbi:MAG: glycosyl transferase, partial [Bacillota bacterium]|nr:glycosyl transferase [Bacillota bacterium]